MLASLAKKGESVLFFGLCPKNKTPLLLLRERSERKSPFKSVFKIYRNYLAYSSLRSQKKGMWFVFSGFARKTNHIFSLARAKRARD
ncbi:MAG: hypothetical protein U5L45_10410 [Saprospiraceae bacterium]|nr:hypothetical protein [Saprospiraceae bacterium]